MSKLKFSPQLDTGRLSEPEAKRYFTTFGLAACVLMIVYHLSAKILSYVLYLLVPQWIGSALLGHLFSIVTIYVFALPCFYLVLRRLPSDTMAPVEMGTRSWWRGLCIALAFMTVGNYIGNFITFYFSSMLGDALQNPVAEMTAGESFWMNLVFVAIVGPILEELVFRKVVCDRLLPLGEGYAVILSAVLFGLVHGNFFQFFYATAVGALFAYVYVKTGRIRYSIAYHMIVNLLGGVIAPWMIDRMTPWLSEEGITRLLEMQTSNFSEYSRVVLTTMLPLLAYEGVFLGGAVLGIVFLVKDRKKIRFREGLLPPPKENRVSTVFCSGGIAAALAVFAIVFVLSLI